MTLTELVYTIKRIAKDYGVVTVTDGEIYANWNDGTIKYNAFNVDISEIKRNGNGQTVTLYMYYGDRLLQDKTNSLYIQDDATIVLQGIINTLQKEKDVLGVNTDYTFTPFEQQFADYLGGAYVNLTVSIKSEVGDCARQKVERTLIITENGRYNVENYERADVDVSTQFVFENGMKMAYWDDEKINEVFPNVVWSTDFNNMKKFFHDCTISSITLPNELTRVSNMSGCFENCANLTSITFPNSWSNITYIRNCFNNCRNLRSVILPTSMSKSTDIYTMFASCTNLRSVTLPIDMRNVTYASSCFDSCYRLTNVVLPTNMDSLKRTERCFYSCSSLQSVVLPTSMSNVTYMDYYFYNCTSLQSINQTILPNISLTNWGLSTCTALTEQSVINMLNSLPTTTVSRTATFGSTLLGKLKSTEGQAALNNAINRGWTIN